jgi:hypothetical protein
MSRAQLETSYQPSSSSDIDVIFKLLLGILACEQNDSSKMCILLH